MSDPAAEGTPKEISRAEAREMLDNGAQLVDVRADHEWETGHLPGAVHIPLPELPARVGEIDKDRPVILYCRGGNRSSMATTVLAEAGYDAAKLSEGATGWEEEGLPFDPEGGYVAESGEAAAILESRKRAS
ncbi:MAG TPA: rhodanese-like domain-containing protein [Solirubrobacterales bacterium]|jgi:rhodanese-related sulfurtransferase